MRRPFVFALAVLTVFAVMVGAGAARCAADSFEVVVVVSPSTINIDSKGTWITVHAEIPFDMVVGDSVALEGVPADRVKSDDRGELVAKFAAADIKPILVLGKVPLTLTGVTYNGDSFYGTDCVLVIKKRCK